MSNVIWFDAYRVAREAKVQSESRPIPPPPPRVPVARAQLIQARPTRRAVAALGAWDMNDHYDEAMEAISAEEAAWAEHMADVREEMDEQSLNWERSEDTGWFYSDND
ncbi:MAG: hypothetical protein IPO95_08670 [Rhodanobacteraceae bacterium]|nr:hypothetical protein [Rhodanobacteraceae bacterium]